MPSAFCVWGIVRLILSFAAVDDAQSQQTDTQEHHGGGFGDLLEKLVLPGVPPSHHGKTIVRNTITAPLLRLVRFSQR